MIKKLNKQLTNQRTDKLITYFTLGYFAVFSVNELIHGNIEFIYYTALMVVSISVITFIHRRLHFYPVVLLSLSVLGLLHLLGGNVFIGDTRLYEYFLIPDIFRYDNLVHMFGSAVMVMLADALLVPVVHKTFERRSAYFIVLLVVVGMGLGSVNEIVEYMAVLTFNVGKWVGDYDNTLLDLVFNTIGSIIMAVFLVIAKPHLTEE